MKNLKLLFLATIFFLFACEKPTEITQIPSEYIGDWEGKIDLELHKNIDAILHIEKDSLNITYNEFDSLYKITCAIEKIEKIDKQKCNNCNEQVLTLFYVVEDAKTKNQTPFIDKLWLSDKNKNGYNLLHIDQSNMYKGEVKTWVRTR